MGFQINITFVKKFLYGFTSREEDDELLNNPEVNGRMAELWDNYSDLKSKDNTPDTEKILALIREKASIPEKQIYTIDDYDYNRRPWYKAPLSIAASVLIFVTLTITGYYFYNKNKNAYVEVVSEIGQRKEFTLPDGSRVWLNSDTRIKYKKQFIGHVREVFLRGEAYFSVVKDASRPFIVKTVKLDIKVLGTVFNVKSYPGEKTVETTLVTGLVSIEKACEKNEAKEAPVLVHPKQKAVFSVLGDKICVEPVNIEKTTSWKNGKLIFDNESLDGVVTKLQRWYGVKIELLGKYKQTEDRFTLTVKDENIEEVIHLLQLTSRLTFKIEDPDGSHKRIYEPINTEENHEIEE